MGPRDTKDVRECEFFKKLRNPKKDVGCLVIYCHDQIPQIWEVGQREPDLAQLLGWALSHQVSDLN